MKKFKKPIFLRWMKPMSLLPVASFILAACQVNGNSLSSARQVYEVTNDNFNNLENKENSLTFGVGLIGNFNYSLQSPSLQFVHMVVEPWIRLASTNAIRPFLSSTNLRAKNYFPQDQENVGAHAIGFDPMKIYPNGYKFDPTNPYDPNAPVPNPSLDPGNDVYGDVPLTDLPLYDFGAADAMVFLSRENTLIRNNLSDTVSSDFTTHRILRFHIRNGLRWSDGTHVKASDYVATIKYILDPAAASNHYSTLVNSVQLRNAQICFVQRSELQSKFRQQNITSEQTWKMSNACQYRATRDDGSATAGDLSWEQSLGVRDIGNNWVEYEFYTGNDDILNLLGSAIFLPTPEHFIEKLPRKIRDYGLAKDKFLSNGAFTLKELQPEYILLAEKNPNYWNAEDVFSDLFRLRIVTQPYIQTTLFEKGIISEIDGISPQLLPSLISNPAIKPFINKGGSSSNLTFLTFSATNLAKNPATAKMNDPDFRRALYYATNRTAVLNGRNTFGILPVGVSVSNDSNESTRPQQRNFYNVLERTDFTPDYPNAKTTKLAKTTFLDRSANNFFDFWGGENGYVRDLDFDPQLARQFYDRWLKNNPGTKQKISFQYIPSDEGLAIALKANLEAVLGNRGFELELEPVLAQSLVARQLVGGFDMTIMSYSAFIENGVSIFNWYMPYVTTSFSGDRLFSGLAFYFGDTLPAYARRLALTNPNRLKELGFDSNRFSSTQDSSYYRLLQTLDQYVTNEDEELLPFYQTSLFRDSRNTDLWKQSEPFAIADNTKNYIFRTGRGIGSNTSSLRYSGNLIINNPLNLSTANQYGLTNPYYFYQFFANLEKLLRDAAFNIPISSYSSVYFATRIVGFRSANFLGFPRNLVHAYRGDLKIRNANGVLLPDLRILGQNF